MSDEIRLDNRGMGRMLRETTGRIVDDVTRQIARQVRPPADSGITADDVKVRAYSTDRHAASVDIEHPDAMEAQLLHGILTQAAGAVGLGVTLR